MEFKVSWYDVHDSLSWCDEYDTIEHISKVYAVDTTRDRFLVATGPGYFRWVDANRCKLEEDDNG